MAKATTVIGRNLPIYKGEYNSATTYDRFDVVLYEGSSYVSKLPGNQNRPVTNTTYWQLLAQRGEFTEQQLEDFKTAVVAESKDEMDDYTDEKKTELDTYEGTKETQLNTYSNELEGNFNSNASEKTTAFNNNATSKTTDFNTNVSTKTTTFNDNASSKTTEFNTNASSKVDEFNANATNKKNDFDEYVEEKKSEFEEVTLSEISKYTIGNIINFEKNGSYPNTSFLLKNESTSDGTVPIKVKFKITRKGDTTGAYVKLKVSNSYTEVTPSLIETPNYRNFIQNEETDVTIEGTIPAINKATKVKILVDTSSTLEFEHILRDVEIYINNVFQDFTIVEDSYNTDESQQINYLATKEFVESKISEIEQEVEALGEDIEEQIEQIEIDAITEAKAEMDDYTDTKKAEMDDYTDTKKAELDTYENTKETELNTYAGGLKDDFDSNASSKTTTFNNNATSKTTDFNDNATSKTTAFNANASTKTNDFDTNVSDKTTAFNDNATSKTTTFNTNATNKTTDFNDNATSKTTAFDNNASSKTTTFNTNATNKTDDFNNNVTAKTTEFDEHVDDKIDELDSSTGEIHEEIDELANTLIWKKTDKSTEMTITDSVTYSKNKMKLFGNTQQKFYSGKNLTSGSDIFFPAIVGYINTIVGKPEKDGENFIFQCNGDNQVRIAVLIDLKPNTTYTISMNTVTGYDSNNEIVSTSLLNTAKYFNSFNINNGVIESSDSSNISVDVNNKTFSITTNENTSQAFMFTIFGNNISKLILENLMIEEGSTATDYEPYTGGISPNPNYPQDIHVVTGNNTIEVQGKNLVDVSPYQEETKNGVTLTKDDEGNIILNGTSTSAGFSWNVNLPETRVLPAGTYTKSITKDANIRSGITVGLGYNGSSISGTTIQPNTGTTTMVREQDTNYDQIRMYIGNRTTFDNYKLSYMILSGEYTTETLPDWEPYYHADYPVSLDSTELCKIGDYQDYLYKENGNWYKYGAMDKYVYNNDLSTNSLTENTVGMLTPVLNIEEGLAGGQLGNTSYCNIMKTTYTNYTGLNGTTAAGKIRINMSTNYVSSYNEFKQVCEDENLTIYFKAKIPVITQITDTTLISQLEAIYNNLALVKGTNYITITASDLAPNIELEYMQDLSTDLVTKEYVDNKKIEIEQIDSSAFGNLYHLQNDVSDGAKFALKLRKTFLMQDVNKIKAKVKVKDCGTTHDYVATSMRIAFRNTNNSDYNYTYGSFIIGNASPSTMPIKNKFYEFENEDNEYSGSYNGTVDSFVLTSGSSSYGEDVYFADLELFINDERVYFDLLESQSPNTTEIQKDSNYIATQDYVKEYVENYNKTQSETQLTLPFVNNLYVVQNNDANGANTNLKVGLPIFIDYLYWATKGTILFKNGLDRAYIHEKTDTQTEQLYNRKTQLQFKSDAYNVSDVEFNNISIKENTPNGKIRLLIIGDSVTAGAVTNKQYWAVAREFFKKEDIDLNRTTDVMFLGNVNHRTVTDTYKNQQYSVEACACGVSSTSLNWWLTEENQYNRFVYTDENQVKHFSINKWLERLRNYDDNGNKLQLNDANIGTEVTADNIDNIMVCTPNIILINHTHNGGTIAQYEEIIETIRAELPDCKIIIGAGMPLIGTWHKELYENVDWLPQTQLDKEPNAYSNYMAVRNEHLNNWTAVERGEASANGRTYDNIYYMNLPVITPTIESYDYYEVDCGIKTMKQVTKLAQNVVAHPGTRTHYIWGYELYALLKFIQATENDATNNFDEVPLYDDSEET